MEEAWGEGLVDIGRADLPDKCIIRDNIVSVSTNKGWEEQVRTGSTVKCSLSICAGGGKRDSLT